MNTIRLLRISFLLGLIGLGTLSYAAQLNPRQNQQMFDKELERALAASREEADLHKALAESKKLAARLAKENNGDSLPTAPGGPCKKTIEQSEREFKEFEAKKNAAASNIRKFKSLKELQTFYKQELQKEADSLEKLFFELSGISKEEFAISKKVAEEELNTIFSKECKEFLPTQGRYNPNDSFKASVILTIHKLKKELGLKNDFTILFDEQGPLKGDRKYYMGVTPLYIQVEVRSCKPLSPLILETTILHEFNHIVFNDSVTRYAMEIVFAQKNKQSQKSFMQLFNFFKEKRADILAWITSKKRAAAGVQDYQSIVNDDKKDGDRDHLREVNHQSHQNRLAIAQQIYAEMCALPGNGN